MNLNQTTNQDMLICFNIWTPISWNWELKAIKIAKVHKDFLAAVRYLRYALLSHPQSTFKSLITKAPFFYIWENSNFKTNQTLFAPMIFIWFKYQVIKNIPFKNPVVWFKRKPLLKINLFFLWNISNNPNGK